MVQLKHVFEGECLKNWKNVDELEQLFDIQMLFTFFPF